MNAKWRSTLMIGLGLAAGVGLAAWLKGPGFPPPSTGAETQRTPRPPGASRAVLQVAADFVCACGRCGDEPLATCDCPRAVEERAFIAKALAAGRSPAQTAAALEQRYGGRRRAASAPPPALGLVSDEAIVQRLGLDTPSQPLPQAAPPSAQSADRAHVLSHFKCPCGQCGMDHLAECECPHPNGAREVKRFIDQLLAANRYTIGEIVALVEQRYGGRIR